ncbi:TPA: hypothetical protein ACKRTJ_000874 [Proteus mirabilis]|uniref:hypothetical protein n=1 Tax=Proteus mirabilis TaxID=584 RepID=UPI000538DE37|nr:hypothetical protein [Proteus mirabilis]AUU37772.1 hypothetical protein MC73_001880 [Proteus mirabilis]EKV7294535.1 hypothetical protein [Proteus mirabilis]EKX9513159.1 hypothetical protein [Proteus mirabilis]MBG5958759.1 hypothetical protein [Proteus mirabilis]MDM3651468.1 hypothetical protein [Proteus mirabilis]
MKERGIIFNAEMVRAILDGRKTQTRRIVKNVMPDNGIWLKKPTKTRSGTTTHVLDAPKHNLCPLGKIGDRIYVRETWSVVSHEFDDDGLMIDYVPDRQTKAVHEMPYGHGYLTGHVIYSADGDFTWGDDDGCVDGRSCWKPSIHMPRWASRITLEITDVRVERLNDISQSDAIAEGAPPSHPTIDAISRECGFPDFSRSWFGQTWWHIYGKKNWQDNPWVWVIEFKRI